MGPRSRLVSLHPKRLCCSRNRNAESSTDTCLHLPSPGSPLHNSRDRESSGRVCSWSRVWLYQSVIVKIVKLKVLHLLVGLEASIADNGCFNGTAHIIFLNNLLLYYNVRKQINLIKNDLIENNSEWINIFCSNNKAWFKIEFSFCISLS